MAIKDMYYTVSEAAKSLSISRQSLYRWITDSKITTEKVGGVTLIKKKAVREYITTRRKQSAFQMMDMELIEAVRKECGYTLKDIIEQIKCESGDYMAFLITRGDGTREEVHVGGMEITIFTNIGANNLEVKKFKLVDVAKVGYKQSQNKSGRGKSK